MEEPESPKNPLLIGIYPGWIVDGCICEREVLVKVASLKFLERCGTSSETAFDASRFYQPKRLKAAA